MGKYEKGFEKKLLEWGDYLVYYLSQSNSK